MIYIIIKYLTIFLQQRLSESKLTFPLTLDMFIHQHTSRKVEKEIACVTCIKTKTCESSCDQGLQD